MLLEEDPDMEDCESEDLLEEIANAAVLGRMCLTSSLPLLMERLTGNGTPATATEPGQPSILHRLAQPVAAHGGGGGGGGGGLEAGEAVDAAAASMLEEARVVVLISGRLLAFDYTSGEEVSDGVTRRTRKDVKP